MALGLSGATLTAVITVLAAGNLGSRATGSRLG